MEAGGVGGVFGGGAGKVVAAAHIFFGAEEEIVGVMVFEHGVDAGDAGCADRSRGQTFVEVGVVGVVDGDMFVEESSDGEVAGGVFEGGVGLEEHTAAQAVEIHAGDEGFLGVVVGLFFYDGGEGDNLYGGESEVGALCFADGGPEAVVFFFHAVEEFLGAAVPVDIVGVGDEHGDDGGGRETVAGAGGAVVEECEEVGGRHFEFGGQEEGEVLFGAVFVDGDAEGVLVAGIELADGGEC